MDNKKTPNLPANHDETLASMHVVFCDLVDGTFEFLQQRRRHNHNAPPPAPPPTTTTTTTTPIVTRNNTTPSMTGAAPVLDSSKKHNTSSYFPSSGTSSSPPTIICSQQEEEDNSRSHNSCVSSTAAPGATVSTTTACVGNVYENSTTASSEDRVWPQGSSCFLVPKDQLFGMRPYFGWAFTMYSSKFMNKNNQQYRRRYHYCLGVFKCQQKSCSFLARPCKPSKMFKGALPAMAPNMKCPLHPQLQLEHIQCKCALTIDVFLLASGEAGQKIQAQHYGYHNHPRPPTKKPHPGSLAVLSQTDYMQQVLGEANSGLQSDMVEGVIHDPDFDGKIDIQFTSAFDDIVQRWVPVLITVMFGRSKQDLEHLLSGLSLVSSLCSTSYESKCDNIS